MCNMAQRERVGVREVRLNLSVYLDRVKRGEALEITERGRSVAMLVPLPHQSSLVARLVAEGRATPPSLPASALPAPRPVKATGPSISQVLEELREDRI
jgi:prevent-host-death family protein